VSAAPRSTTSKIVVRSLLLLVMGASLYFLIPSLVETFSSWPQLRGIDPLWSLGAIGFEAASFISMWALLRIALGSRRWFGVATSQLAANAAGRVVPGGAAPAGALQYSMLVRAGFAPGRVASALTATLAATTATVLALPVVASLAALGGSAAPEGLRRVSYAAGAAFLAFGAVCVVAFTWDRPLWLLGRGVRHIAGWIGRRARFDGTSTRLLSQRNAIRRALRLHPIRAFLAALGKWGFDYLALLCVLAALGVHANEASVLIAYAGAAVLGMIPLTPGGLGFVEAGLTGMLVLAGVSAPDAAAATLAYRLVSFWLPLPAGLVAYWLARRRYGPSSSATSAETSEATIAPS
jgi:uncharacterized membrane protein YbhN (UPF0104 family)